MSAVYQTDEYVCSAAAARRLGVMSLCNMKLWLSLLVIFTGRNKAAVLCDHGKGSLAEAAPGGPGAWASAEHGGSWHSMLMSVDLPAPWPASGLVL